MNEIPSSLGVFLYAAIAFVLFTGIPLTRYFIRRSKTKKEEQTNE